MVDVAGATEAETISDALDIHYIESCKMLTSCVACDKVVEITKLSHHMISECEHRDKAKKCMKCKKTVVDLAKHICDQ